MGLDESFTQVRIQLLLMEPESTINRAFSLIVQEVDQLVVNSPPVVSSVVCPCYTSVATSLMAKSSSARTNSTRNNRCFENYSKKERPTCSHCGIKGHTVERCYKVHGYPPGYCALKSFTDASPNTNAPSDSWSSLTTKQCQGLLNMLQSHFSNAKQSPCLLV